MNKEKIINSIQKTLAFMMGISFLVGLIPFYYTKVYPFLVVLIIIQLILSLLRKKVLNLFFELFLVAFIFFSLVPLLGYVFRILGFLFSLLDMAGFNGISSFRAVNINNFKTKNDKTKGIGIKDIKKKPKFKDAEFREK